MIPVEIPKYRFAMRLYGISNRRHAAQKLKYEYSNSPELRERLAAVGYNPKRKILRRAELQVYQEVLALPDDFWD